MPVLLSSEEFQQYAARSWQQLIDQLFPEGVPTHTEWKNPTEMVRVLNHMCSTPGVNVLFLPHSGRLEVYGAFSGKEPEQIELETSPNSRYGERRVCKPAMLSFESFNNSQDYQFSYFRLDLLPLPILHNQYMMPGNLQEEVTELGPGRYVSRRVWDNRFENEDESLPKSARHIIRILGGSLILLQKMGNYDRARGTDNGFHDKFSPVEFRNLMAGFNRDYKRD